MNLRRFSAVPPLCHSVQLTCRDQGKVQAGKNSLYVSHYQWECLLEVCRVAKVSHERSLSHKQPNMSLLEAGQAAML